MLEARRRDEARVPRRPPIRDLARRRRCGARAIPRRQERAGAAEPRFTAAWLGSRLAMRRAAVSGSPRPAGRRRPGEHLRRRGAVARACKSIAPCARPRRGRVRRLQRAIRAALRAGIERQGSTLSEYRTPDGSRGAMREEFRVYGRDGLPCRRCGTTITKTRVGGRGVVPPSPPAVGLGRSNVSLSRAAKEQ